MRHSYWKSAALVVLGGVTSCMLAGCQRATETAAPAGGAVASDPHAGHDHDHGDHEGHDHGKGEGHGGTSQASHDHSGWWCAEHGIPEEVCTRCDSSLIAGFKEKGDWCDEHDRPDTQCFHCHPELAAKFAARYEAKFGEKPPTVTDP